MWLLTQVSKAISWVHLSGILHDTVSADPAAYLHSNPELLPLLQQARAAGKQLFLLSNSAFGFIDKGLEFLVGPTWREMGLFDVIVTSAQKPSFYRRDSPFRAYSGSGSFVKWSKASTSDVCHERLERPRSQPIGCDGEPRCPALQPALQPRCGALNPDSHLPRPPSRIQSPARFEPRVYRSQRGAC